MGMNNFEGDASGLRFRTFLFFLLHVMFPAYLIYKLVE